MCLVGVPLLSSFICYRALTLPGNGRGILRYDSVSDEWTEVGTMVMSRDFPAIGLIDNINDICP